MILTQFLVAGSWMALNQLRLHYYNDAMEGRQNDSPYWLVIRAQEILGWPVKLLAGALGLISIYEIARGSAKLVQR